MLASHGSSLASVLRQCWRPLGFASKVLVLCLACSDSDQPQQSGSGSGSEDDADDSDDSSTDDGSFLNGADDDLIAGEEQDMANADGLPNECARESFEGERVDVNLHLVVDISGSMTSLISETSTRWDAVRDAMTEFINSPQSTGLNIALSYYPHQEPRELCSSNAQCGEFSSCYTHLCLVDMALGIPVNCRPSRPSGLDPANCQIAIVEENGEPVLKPTDELQRSDEILLPPVCQPSGLCSNDGTKLCLIDEDCDGGGTCEVSSDEGICPGTNSCDEADYAEPSVAIQPLPGGAMDLVDSLAGVEPDVFALTPTHVALQGAFTHTAEWLQDAPNAQSFVVLATDGFPEGCALVNALGQTVSEPPELTLEELQRGREGGMSTFIIGVVDDQFDVDGEGRAALARMAEAGGTDEALIVTADDTTADGFLAALDAIRGQVLPCEYKIPRPTEGVTDFDLVNVEVSQDGETQIAPRVEDAGACVEGELGWHYDVALSDDGPPNNIVLCPQTCEQINAESGNQVDVVLGCKTIVKVK